MYELIQTAPLRFPSFLKEDTRSVLASVRMCWKSAPVVACVVFSCCRWSHPFIERCRVLLPVAVAVSRSKHAIVQLRGGH